MPLAFDDRGEPAGPHQVDHQAPPDFGAQVRQMHAGLGDHRDPFLDVKQARFVGIHQHGDDDLVELRGRPFEHVDVPQGHRVE